MSFADSLGSKQWRTIAHAAEIPAVDAFVECMADSTVMVAVGEDLRKGHRLGVRGTPTLVVDDLVIEGNPPPRILRSILDRARQTQGAGSR